VHVSNNHYIIVVLHTVKEEFQVLNSGGKISQRVRKMIETLVSLQTRIDMNIILLGHYLYIVLFTFLESTNWYRSPTGKQISTSETLSGYNFVANKGVRHAVTDGYVSLLLKSMSQIMLCYILT
jgi:hypothetical protein